MDRTLEPVLSLTCPQCRSRFDSALRIDEIAFYTADITPTVERCSGCGHVSRYEQRDYFFTGPED